MGTNVPLILTGKLKMPCRLSFTENFGKKGFCYENLKPGALFPGGKSGVPENTCDTGTI
jgi:hypothetical protein